MNAIADKLKAKRLENNLSIEQIASELNIRKQYLLDIEEGRYNAIPGRVYVEGYIRLYANYLGVEIDSIKDLINVESSHNVGGNTKNNFNSQPLTKPYIESSTPSRFFHLISFVILLLISYIWSMYSKYYNTTNTFNPTISLYNTNDKTLIKPYYNIKVDPQQVANSQDSLHYFLTNYPAIKEDKQITIAEYTHNENIVRSPEKEFADETRNEHYNEIQVESYLGQKR